MMDKQDGDMAWSMDMTQGHVALTCRKDMILDMHHFYFCFHVHVTWLCSMGMQSKEMDMKHGNVT
jgi:hypothetical protein